LRQQLDWPVEGVPLDVEHNGFSPVRAIFSRHA
jgi:hypothetical protein